MTPVRRAFLFRGLRDDATARQILEPLSDRLVTGNVSATIDRLFKSKHLYDLRLIVAVGLIIVFWICVIAALVAVCTGYLNFMSLLKSDAHTPLVICDDIVSSVIAAFGALLTLVGPTFVVFYGLLTWAYQVGNSRLGVVDLFACEIDTLCRVVTVVDMVRHRVEQFDRNTGPGPAKGTQNKGAPNPAGRPFNSQEDYFPILNSSVANLQSLEARVVTNITAFYTFMKTVRDALRQVPEESEQPVVSKEAAQNVLYTLYLGLESGRKAIGDLVEFEPDRTEREMVILISELSGYAFLRRQFDEPGEMRHERLLLRQLDYKKLVPGLCKEVEGHKASAFSNLDSPGLTANQSEEASRWRAAYQLLHELRARYDVVEALPFDCAPVNEMSHPS